MSEAPDSKALQVINWIVQNAVEGIPPLTSASDLALEYKIDQSYVSTDDRVSSLINWETSKNFTSGFITGLGGLITLPVSIPAAFGASWIIQARMAGAIAELYGHKTTEDRVRTLVLLSLVGDSAKEIVKQAGIKVGNIAFEKVIQQIPGKLLIEINKNVGFRLLTKAGQRGVVNLMKMVPLAGGLVGGAFDAAACRAVGKTAITLFASKKQGN